jgi:hypothetical protein
MNRFTAVGRLTAGASTLALVLAACASPDARLLTQENAVIGVGPVEANHVGCVAGGKYTGGGRVDPDGVGKVTFGFNIHAGDCDRSEMKGNIQVVYHETQTLVHSLTEANFSSFVDPVKGQCGEWDGMARVKHVFAGGDWHEHHYFVEVCDKGEPGRGADRFSFYLQGAGDGVHNNVIEEILTGGNIQAHKN